MLAALREAVKRLHRVRVAGNRMKLRRARHDHRAWVVKRRERTRQLIELGGLIAKSGLVDLVDDDRAVLFGILVEAAATLHGANRDQHLLLWRRRGKRAFADDGPPVELNVANSDD